MSKDKNKKTIDISVEYQTTGPLAQTPQTPLSFSQTISQDTSFFQLSNDLLSRCKKYKMSKQKSQLWAPRPYNVQITQQNFAAFIKLVKQNPFYGYLEIREPEKHQSFIIKEGQQDQDYSSSEGGQVAPEDEKDIIKSKKIPHKQSALRAGYPIQQLNVQIEDDIDYQLLQDPFLNSLEWSLDGRSLFNDSPQDRQLAKRLGLIRSIKGMPVEPLISQIINAVRRG